MEPPLSDEDFMEQSFSEEDEPQLLLDPEKDYVFDDKYENHAKGSWFDWDKLNGMKHSTEGDLEWCADKCRVCRKPAVPGVNRIMCGRRRHIYCSMDCGRSEQKYHKDWCKPLPKTTLSRPTQDNTNTAHREAADQQYLAEKYEPWRQRETPDIPTMTPWIKYAPGWEKRLVQECDLDDSIDKDNQTRAADNPSKREMRADKDMVQNPVNQKEEARRRQHVRDTWKQSHAGRLYYRVYEDKEGVKKFQNFHPDVPDDNVMARWKLGKQTPADRKRVRELEQEARERAEKYAFEHVVNRTLSFRYCISPDKKYILFSTREGQVIYADLHAENIAPKQYDMGYLKMEERFGSYLYVDANRIPMVHYAEIPAKYSTSRAFVPGYDVRLVDVLYKRYDTSYILYRDDNPCNLTMDNIIFPRCEKWREENKCNAETFELAPQETSPEIRDLMRHRWKETQSDCRVTAYLYRCTARPSAWMIHHDLLPFRMILTTPFKKHEGPGLRKPNNTLCKLHGTVSVSYGRVPPPLMYGQEHYRETFEESELSTIAWHCRENNDTLFLLQRSNALAFRDEGEPGDPTVYAGAHYERLLRGMSTKEREYIDSMSQDTAEGMIEKYMEPPLRYAGFYLVDNDEPGIDPYGQNTTRVYVQENFRRIAEDMFKDNENGEDREVYLPLPGDKVYTLVRPRCIEVKAERRRKARRNPAADEGPAHYSVMLTTLDQHSPEFRIEVLKFMYIVYGTLEL